MNDAHAAIDIREAGLGDIDRLVPLFVEMEDYYGEASVTVEDARDCLEKCLVPGPNQFVLAAFTPEAVGFATVFQMFPGAGLQGVWFLKELYVSGRARGLALGERMMRVCAQTVVDRGGIRFDFTTDGDNQRAQRFYDRLEAERVPKVFYRFEGERLGALARGAISGST